jgi:nucleotide-binding universal stress UspA family protein
MQLLPSPNAKAHMLRASRGQRLIFGCPAKLRHLLALVDLQPGSNAALELATELAELFRAQLTLMHGGESLQPSIVGRGDQAEAFNPSNPALLCLAWELRRRCPEVGLCLDPGYLPEQVWHAAALRDVDLIVLSQALFSRFRPLVTGSGSDEMIEGAPCPVLVVESTGPTD